MDLCNKLLLKCSALIALSLALQIFTSPATSHEAKETTVHNTTQNNKNTTAQQEKIFSNLYNNSYINTERNNPTNRTRYNSTNSPDFARQHSLTVPTPTAEITTHLINVTATKTDFATQSATTLSTPRPSVSTVHESTTKSTPAYFTTETDIGNKTNNETAAGAGLNLNHSEMSLTILFSVVLGMTLLIILALAVYKMPRSKPPQYSHHPLHNEDTGGLFMVTDETLVTAKGLYDDPQIYKSTVTALNEDQTFTYTPTQLRLEFLIEDPATDHTQEATTIKTFNMSGQQP